MPQIKYSQKAIDDLQRLSGFLLETANPEIAANAMQTIADKIGTLADLPNIGSPVPNEVIPNLRKLIVSFGKNGYIVLYSYQAESDLVLIETIRHSRELEPDFLRFPFA